jgi:hypothetical protein
VYNETGPTMKIGTDLDGVLLTFKFLNPSVKLPQWLYLPLAIFALLCPPNFVIKRILQFAAKNNEIIVISARPKWFTPLTVSWLKFHQIPFNKLYCIGFGKGTKERKLEIIRKEGIDIYFEDDKRIVQFFKKHAIKVISIYCRKIGIFYFKASFLK